MSEPVVTALHKPIPLGELVRLCFPDTQGAISAFWLDDTELCVSFKSYCLVCRPLTREQLLACCREEAVADAVRGWYVQGGGREELRFVGPGGGTWAHQTDPGAVDRALGLVAAKVRESRKALEAAA